MAFRDLPPNTAFFDTLRSQLRISRMRHGRDAIAMFVLGAIGVLAYPAIPDARLLAFGGLGVLSACAVWVFVAFAGGWSPALKRLIRDARDVVWVFTEIGARDPRHAALVFAFADGTSVTIPVEASAKDALLSQASMQFATASMGFSSSLREAFLRDPRAMLGPPRTRPVGASTPLADYAWLVEPARATQRRSHIVGVLTALVAVLGVLGFALVLAAAPPGDERAILATTFGITGFVGLVSTAFAFRPFESTALYRALKSSEGLANVQLVEGNGPTGDVIPMAVVTLKSGARYTFYVSPRPPRPSDVAVFSVHQPDTSSAPPYTPPDEP